MSNYALVEDGVVTKAGGLPKNWGNVSSLNLASDTELKGFGWLPLTETVVETSKYEVKTGISYVISAEGVVAEEQKRVMTTDEKTAKDTTDATAYQRARKAKYDELNQFDLQYQDKENSTDTWGEAIEAIKAAHPKPE